MRRKIQIPKIQTNLPIMIDNSTIKFKILWIQNLKIQNHDIYFGDVLYHDLNSDTKDTTATV